MLDGAIGLIILIAAFTGAARGIGDSILRLAGFAGGLVGAVFLSSKVAAFLSGTRLSNTLHTHIFSILRPESDAEAVAGQTAEGEGLGGLLGVQQSDPYSDSLPKSLGGVASELADKTADAAAGRLTEIAIGIISFVLVMLAVWLVFALIRMLLRYGRRNSVVIGFIDRVFGFVLGVFRGTLLSFVAAAALMPVTALVAPARVPDMLTALHQTYLAEVIYDINPLLLLLNHFY